MTNTELEADVIDAALAGFRDMMGSDGYRVVWVPESETGDRLSISIEAGPEACADCLSPTPVMEAILQKQLEGTPYTVGTVSLPSGH